MLGREGSQQDWPAVGKTKKQKQNRGGKTKPKSLLTTLQRPSWAGKGDKYERLFGCTCFFWRGHLHQSVEAIN
jgi:hypothetical protein